ncbi:2-oxoglutarate-dependent dioxygenase [Xylophilus rhododendri]|uniref:2-oxoglutarate-dependent dioxygenase n=1 Tax=Xylophilus rhododendri TaxID=2697032 RepID=A0A857J9W4_9BURK|nr:2OG-Fe(II) oxygenase [Xylophilus rhododendri]QHJ00518.1 2-oxoglutarate-dependent dioxygenase [Xylophilus rhododendri]
MPTLARFPPALGDWIAAQLAQGWAPPAVVEALDEQGIPPRASRAIVGAFERARSLGLPPPLHTVELEDIARLPPGPVLQAAGRAVRVAARFHRQAGAVLSGVLDADECARLIGMARPRLKPSTVVDPATGRDTVTGLRGSLGMFFLPAENPLVARIDRLCAELMNLPESHGEGLQLLYYPPGAGSAPHHDYLEPSNQANQASIARSGQRVSTLVTYLHEPEGGGETVFPELGVSVSPQRGNAVYFEYCNESGEVDPALLHASSAVSAGEKWVATKWMRERPFVSAGQAAALR